MQSRIQPTKTLSSCLFFFFCVRCDDRAKSPGRWLLGSPPSAVVRQLAPRAWCPLQCLPAKTVGVLSPGVGRPEECAQGFAPQSHIHSGLNQQDLVCLDVFLAHSDQFADGRWWFGSSCQGCESGLSAGHILSLRPTTTQDKLGFSLSGLCQARTTKTYKQQTETKKRGNKYQ